MFKIILWDLDNTLLNFLSAETYSLKRRFEEYGLGVCTDEMALHFDSLNNIYWQLLEEKKLTRYEALTLRFAEFFDNEGVNYNGDLQEFNLAFENGIADKIFFVENGYEIVKSLKGSYKQYAVTNGSEFVQSVRLKKSGFDRLFDGVFISDAVGYDKPSVNFFNHVLEHIVPCKKEDIIIIGDSLTSDMLGGNNIGIKTCWYNPQGKPNDRGVKIDFEIKNLNEIYDIIKK